MSRPKTVFCDIDGTLLKHHGDIIANAAATTDASGATVLPGAFEHLKAWEKANYRIILITGRKESERPTLERTLQSLHVPYDQLLMGLPNGDRVIINDRKPEGQEPTAYALSPARNEGLIHYTPSLEPPNMSNIYDERIDKPWGYEELVELNHAYVVKKLFMRAGHACSIQYHRCKRETILVFSGKLRIYIGATQDTLESREYGPGETVTIEPYTIHRMEGVEDSVYYETSTTELWDVVRLQDSYGRV